MTAPLVQLRRYQQEVFRNPLGILFFIWRRQCGKSYGLGLIGLDWMLETPGITVVFMSAALRLGMENIRKEAEVWRDVNAKMRAAANAQGQYKMTFPGADDDDGNASETIDGATTVTIVTQWSGKMIQSDGSNWIVIGTF